MWLSGIDTIDGPVLLWFVILVAVTLQASFLTLPVGFVLFCLKGVCPPKIQFVDVYRGLNVFVLCQLTGVAFVITFPTLVTWLWSVAYS